MTYTKDSLLTWSAAGNVAGIRGALAAGADPNQKDERGWTSLHLLISQRKKEGIGLLIEAGADPEIENPHGDDALSMAAQRDDVEILDAIQVAMRKRGQPVGTDNSGAAPRRV